MKKQNFKKLGITLIALIIAITTFLPTRANAQVKEIAEAIEAIIDAVCPETPQRRCKQNTCQDGACISFRSACTSNSDCG